jgi:hypothetical protein
MPTRVVLLLAPAISGPLIWARISKLPKVLEPAEGYGNEKGKYADNMIAHQPRAALQVSRGSMVEKDLRIAQ